LFTHHPYATGTDSYKKFVATGTLIYSPGISRVWVSLQILYAPSKFASAFAKLAYRFNDLARQLHTH
jgi:hypothetical protein